MSPRAPAEDPKEMALGSHGVSTRTRSKSATRRSWPRTSSTPGTPCRSSTRWCAVVEEGAPVTDTAAAFGYSRPAYYAAASALEYSGLEGLVPGKPGPRGGHKLTGRILTWPLDQLAPSPTCAPRACSNRSPPRSASGCTPGRSSAPWHGTGRNPKRLTSPPPTRLLTRGPHHPHRPALTRALTPAGWTPATNTCVMPPCTPALRLSRSGSGAAPGWGHRVATCPARPEQSHHVPDSRRGGDIPGCHPHPTTHRVGRRAGRCSGRCRTRRNHPRPTPFPPAWALAPGGCD